MKKRAMENDINNFNLGVYMMYAFNEPKKYPKEPLLKLKEDKEVNKIMTSEQMENIARTITSKLGGEIK